MHKEGYLTAHFVQHDEFSNPEYYVFIDGDDKQMCIITWSENRNEWLAEYFDNDFSYKSIIFVNLVTLLDHINFLTRQERNKWTFGMI